MTLYYELWKVFHNGDTVTNWQTYMINLESHLYSTLRVVVKPLHVGYAYTATNFRIGVLLA